MEDNQQPIETEGATTTLTEKTEDEHGGHELEQAGGDSEENRTGTDETAKDDSREDREDPDAKSSTKATGVSAQASTIKSTLAKKEERLKRLRDLHLRRVHNPLLYPR